MMDRYSLYEQIKASLLYLKELKPFYRNIIGEVLESKFKGIQLQKDIS